MNISSLGHSCFLVEIEGDRSEPVRILADPWITDHVIGDLCGRYPRIRLDFEKLPTIDAIYLSHSHTDHCDPYSLLELRAKLPNAPTLLLPVSLAYLEPLFEEYLPEWPRQWLAEGEAIVLDGIEISALFNLETSATNEDDVMVLVVRNETEMLVSESDALLPFHDPGARESIASLFLELDDESAPVNRVFITTRNELGATMASLRALTPEARREAAAESAAATLEEIESILAPVEDGMGGEFAAPWDLPGAVRLIIGQGIAAPQDFDAEWNRVLFPISLGDRARFETQVASQYGYELPIESMTGGDSVEIVGGVVTRKTIPWLTALDPEEERTFDPTLPKAETEFAIAPLIDGPRDLDRQRQLILDVLNRRFVPWWIGSRNPPVEHVLSQCGGQYRVRVRYGTASAFKTEDYVASFRRLEFTPAPPTDDRDAIQEEYWGNDLEDYLDGRADDFSTFCRRPPGGSSTRVWDSLGMPYLNDDLVAKKMRIHFDRAAAGKSGGDWVLPIWRGEAPT